jgi:hypothetical protein
MVFVAGVEGGGDGQRKFIGVVAGYSENFGGSLHLDVISFTQPQAVTPYGFFFKSFVLNYAPVMPLPSATIPNNFKLELGNIWERMYFVNEYYGSIGRSYFIVELRQWDILYLTYGAKILNENARLEYYNAIIGSPTLATVPSLL